MSGSTDDPQRIERDLNRTRSRLDTHLTELQDKLSPGQVVDDLMSYFRGSEGADFGRNLLESVRANPLPAAITGIGLAWLMASRPGAAAPQGMTPVRPASAAAPRRPLHLFNEGGHEATTARVGAAERGIVRDAGEPEHAYGARLDAARGQALGLVRHAQESTESFGQRVREVLAYSQQAVADGAHSLRDGAGSVAGTVGGAAGNVATSVGGAASSVAGTIGGAAQRAGGLAAQGAQATTSAGGSLAATLTENPVLLGALGLAAGALLGALLPQSDSEEAALGGIAGQARTAARDLAQEVADKGARVAQAVVDKGSDSAGAHGLTGSRSPGELVDAALSGSLAADAKQVVTDVLQTGDQTVRREALGQDGGAKPGT